MFRKSSYWKPFTFWNSRLSARFSKEFAKKLSVTCIDTFEKLQKVYGIVLDKLISGSNGFKMDENVLKALSDQEDL